MSFYDGLRALDGFSLGAAMQTSPMLDDYDGWNEPDDYSPPPSITKPREPKPSVQQEGPEPDLFSRRDEKPAHPKVDPTSYNNLLKVFCGSHDLASYWFDKIHHIRK